MYVDFYLPSKRTFIEFNGKQHYKPCERFGGIKSYERQKKRDEILRIYAEVNGYKLIEIPYTEIKNTEAILTEMLNKQ